MEKEITNKDLAKSIEKLAVITGSNTKSLELIATTTAKILETMATKEDLYKTELKLQTQINGIEVDLKSFKKDTKDSFKELNEKFDNLHDTNMGYDKRIETLEAKIA